MVEALEVTRGWWQCAEVRESREEYQHARGVLGRSLPAGDYGHPSVSELREAGIFGDAARYFEHRPLPVGSRWVPEIHFFWRFADGVRACRVYRNPARGLLDDEAAARAVCVELAVEEAGRPSRSTTG